MSVKETPKTKNNKISIEKITDWLVDTAVIVVLTGAAVKGIYTTISENPNTVSKNALVASVFTVLSLVVLHYYVKRKANKD